MRKIVNVTGIKKMVPVFCYVVCTIIMFLVLIKYREQITETNVAKVGETAVMALYDFGTVEQLDSQMAVLKQITTDEVFNQLTIDDEERTLNTYLKFKNEAVTVKIITSTSKYVMYSLDTPNISEERLFVFFFTVNSKGLIDSVREVEAIDFIDSYS